VKADVAGRSGAPPTTSRRWRGSRTPSTSRCVPGRICTDARDFRRLIEAQALLRACTSMSPSRAGLPGVRRRSPILADLYYNLDGVSQSREPESGRSQSCHAAAAMARVSHNTNSRSGVDWWPDPRRTRRAVLAARWLLHHSGPSPATESTFNPDVAKAHLAPGEDVVGLGL